MIQSILPPMIHFAQIAGPHPGAILAVAPRRRVRRRRAGRKRGAQNLLGDDDVYNDRARIMAVATRIWAAAQWLLNAAMSANPIALAIIAVAALTAGVVLAYRHSAKFREIVNSRHSRPPSKTLSYCSGRSAY